MKKLRTPSGIKSLTIGPGQNDLFFIGRDLRKVLLNSLKEFRNLGSLKITCVPFSDFPVFRRAFKSFRGLGNLEIVFKRTTFEIDRNCPRDFIQAFSPRLTQLKLTFPESFSLRGQREDCRSHLRNYRIDALNNLQKLSLSFPISKFLQAKNPKGDSGYIDLSPMKRLNRLQSLDIALFGRYCEKMMQIDTRKLHFDPNKLFPNLKEFTWVVFDRKELDLLGPQIASQLKRLDDFGLGFGHSMAKLEIKELSQRLAILQTDLNRLHFGYNCGELSKQDAKTLLFVLSLKRLEKLHTLSLEFINCKGITNGVLTDLAQACATNFAELRALRLCFKLSEEFGPIRPSLIKALFGNEGISDRGIKSLFQKLERFKRLKTVWIRFGDC